MLLTESKVGEKPIISIVIPCYNSGIYLPYTLETLKNLTSLGAEIIIVDDGSTDNTREVVKPFLGESVRYYAQRNSGGPASPRNLGIMKARASLIGFFDSDDVSISEHFLCGVALMREYPNVGLLCGNYHISDDCLRVKRARVLDQYSALQNVLVDRVGKNTWLLKSDTAFGVLLQKNFVGTPSVIIRKSVFYDIGYFDQSLKNLDDRDMWLRVARHYDLIYRDEPTFIYRSVSTSISKQNLERQALERTSVGKKLLSAGLRPHHRSLAKRWISRNFLEVGYIRIGRSKVGALEAFFQSFFYEPSWAAFKGIVRSVLPEALNRGLARLKN